MITEDYVGFETAKLLREKGFTANIHGMYDHDGKFCEATFTDVEPYYCCYAPTLQMAMKWLREERKINIEIFTYWSIQEKAVYGSRIVSVEHAANVFKEIDIAYNTYEQACEAAIKYCLEKLI